MLSRVLGLFLQAPCGLCDRPCPENLCLDCQRQLLDCTLQSAIQPASLRQRSSAVMPVVSWGRYGGSLKRAIARLKYDGHRELAAPLGIWLGEHWQRAVSQELAHTSHPSPPLRPIVVPIPLHPDKQKQRGFNQAALIAESFCQRTRLPLLKQGLIRIRATAPQFGLSGAARQENLSQAFRLGESLQRYGSTGNSPATQATSSATNPEQQGATAVQPAQTTVGIMQSRLFKHRQVQRSVLLLDDIYTSGATAQAACDVIQAAGIPVCGIVTVARAGQNQT